MQLTDQQLTIAHAVRDGRGNLAVNAGAGSGKTSTAMAVIKDYIPSTEGVLYCAFNRKIKQEVEKKFADLKERVGTRGFSNAAAKTFNGIAYGAFMSRKNVRMSDIEMNEQKYLKLARKWVDEHMSHLIEEDRDIAADIINGVIHYARVNTTYALTGSYDVVVLTGKHEDDSPHYVPLEAPYFFGNEHDVHILREIAWKYDLFGQLEKDEDEERLLKAVPELLAQGKQMMDSLICNFTDQVYWMVIEKWKVWKNKWVIVDECLPYKTPIHLSDGTSMNIGDIVENKLSVEVLAYDTKTGEQRPCKVTNWSKTLNQKQLVKIKVEWRKKYGGKYKSISNFVVCTTDHKVWANDQWIYAGNIEPGMKMQVETSAKKSQAYKIASTGRKTLSELMSSKNETGVMIGNRAPTITVRGGNGRGLTLPQSILLNELGEGWEAEHVFVVPKELRAANNYPNCYKIDIANVAEKIAIEIDGGSHQSPKSRIRDDKKQSLLESFGWRVLRFRNRQLVQQTQQCVCEILGDGCPIDATVISVEPVDIPDNFVYDITVEDCHNFYANGILVHNCQDLSPLFRALVDNCFDALRGGRVLMIGDPCQPEGTLVSMADGSQKPIECLVTGDKVVSYNSRDNAFRKAGRVVTGITKRPFSGNLVTVETENGIRSEYTPNHHCYANFSPLRNKYAVYMMRKGDYYRIGIARMDYKGENLGCGVIRRMRDERADAAWILAVYDTREEAFVMEAAISGKFGVPQLRFVDAANSVVMNSVRIAQAWQWIGENYERARVCLEYFGREINFPLVINEPGKYLSLKRPMIVHASNLMDGVLMLPYIGHTHPKNVALDSAWRPIKIGKREYNGFVYSLNVEIDHLYIADDLVTHNCQAIYGFTGADNDGFANSMRFWKIDTALPLTISWRCPVKVAELARAWKTDFQAAPNALEGVVGNTSEEALVRDAQAGDAIISRTRGPMIPIWQKLVAKGKPAIIVGNDVSKSIIKILERVSKRADFKFVELPVYLREYKDAQLTKMKKKDKPQDELDRFIDQMEAVNGAVDAVEASSMEELIRKIKDIFAKNDEEIDETQAVMIMTGHTCKGLEFNRVYMLTPTLFPMNYPGQSHSAQIQEMNLRYVVQTRAMRELLMVTSKKEPTAGKPVTPAPEVIVEPLSDALNELDTVVQKLLDASRVEIIETPLYDAALIEELLTECLSFRKHLGHPIVMNNHLRHLGDLAQRIKDGSHQGSTETLDTELRVGT